VGSKSRTSTDKDSSIWPGGKEPFRGGGRALKGWMANPSTRGQKRHSPKGEDKRVVKGGRTMTRKKAQEEPAEKKGNPPVHKTEIPSKMKKP